MNQFIITFENGTNFYVETICPVVMIESSYDINKAKIFNSIEDAIKECKDNGITKYDIHQIKPI